MVGSPRWGGISLKHTACTPRAALRRTSAAASSRVPQRHDGSGMRRPPLSPHHSSTIQSLYASTHACASSRSLRLEERLAAEARERREAERRLDPVHLHVVDAGLRARSSPGASRRR